MYPHFIIRTSRRLANKSCPHDPPNELSSKMIYLSGTPPQKVRLAFRSSSEDTVVAAKLCSACCKHELFDSTTSSTYQATGETWKSHHQRLIYYSSDVLQVAEDMPLCVQLGNASCNGIYQAVVVWWEEHGRHRSCPP